MTRRAVTTLGAALPNAWTPPFMMSLSRGSVFLSHNSGFSGSDRFRIQLLPNTSSPHSRGCPSAPFASITAAKAARGRWHDGIAVSDHHQQRAVFGRSTTTGRA